MRIFSWIITGLAMVCLPLLGYLWSQGDVASLFVFPPEFGRVQHAPFNLILSILILAVLPAIPLLWHFLKRRDRIFRHHLVQERRHFPKWGYAGYFLMFIAWIVAWGGVNSLAFLRPYTFTPIWLGFLIAVNGQVHRLSNTAPIYKTPGRFLLLFPLSACFWWVFEYLNRFSENWIYTGSENISALHYYSHGSLCFSTVLPAVYSVFRLLNSYNGMHRFFFLGPRISFLKSRSISLVFLTAGLTSLIGVGAYPHFFYPALWLGPLCVFGGMQGLQRSKGGITEWARGDWRWVAYWAIAGLICGFFWEFWNFFSLLKWKYSLSYFNGLKVFEMPLLGYLGYLPFGILCGLVTQWVFPQRAAIEFSPND